MTGLQGMDLVDAITEWTQRTDEELDDDDIDAILRIQLAIDASDWTRVDVDTLSARDVASIKAELFDVDSPEFTAWVIDETLSGLDIVPPAGIDPPGAFEANTYGRVPGVEPADSDDTDEPTDTDTEESDATDDSDEPTDTDTDDATPDSDDSDEPTDTDTDESDATDDTDELDAADGQDPTAGGSFAGAVSTATETGPESSAPEASGERFFADLERDRERAATPLEFREGPDSLGPTFLPPPKPRRSSRVALAMLSLAAVVAFVLAGLQLAESVREGGEDTEVATDDDGTDSSDTTDNEDAEAGDDRDDGEDPDDSDDDAAASSDVNESDDESAGQGDDDGDGDGEGNPSDNQSDDGTAAAGDDTDVADDLPPAESRAIVLTADGAVLAIDLFLDTIGDPELLFGGPDGEPARAVEVSQTELLVVTDDGHIEVLAIDGSSDTVRVWDADELGPVTQVVDVGERYLALESSGSIAAFEDDAPASAAAVTRPWDTSVGGRPPARQIDAYQDLVPFVLGNGDVQMVITSVEGDPLAPIWDGENQPRAGNISIDETGLLIGVGQGGIARYRWFDNEAPITAVWDPFSGSRLPAIGYAPVADATAVVLNNGTVALIDDSGSGPILWDAEATDLRARAVSSSSSEVLLLLDGGSVVRIDPDDESSLLGSVWDVTDEALSPAVKVLVVDS